MWDHLAKTGFFGMHHPDQADQWVNVQAHDIGANKCKVTITVDENDKVTAISIIGSGPVRPEDVKAVLMMSPIFNSATFAGDLQNITNLYNKLGYSIEFGKPLGMDPASAGSLVVPIIVTRVEEIEVRKDGVPAPPSDRVLTLLKTKAGDYFNRKTFYEMDRKY